METLQDAVKTVVEAITKDAFRKYNDFFTVYDIPGKSKKSATIITIDTWQSE